MKKTILLIGSSGFIGTQLIKKLKNDYNLINVNKSNGFDVCKRNSFNKYSLKKIDFILNLSGQNNSNYNLMKKTIIDGNNNIINYCKKKNTIVYYFSTSLVYGFSNYKKKENSFKKPLCKYSKLKLKAEHIYLKSSINYKILRICNLYDDKKKGIIKNLINCIYKKNLFLSPNIQLYRNYLFIDDFVSIICKSIKIQLKSKIYNIGYENIKLHTMIKLIESKIRLKLNYKNKNIDLKKIPSQKIDSKKILNEINYCPKIGLLSYLTKKIS